MGRGTISGSVWLWALFSSLFILWNMHAYMHWSGLSEYVRGPLCGSPGFSLCTTFFSLLFWLENPSCLHLTDCLALSPPFKESTRLYLDFPLPGPWPENSCKAISHSNCRAGLVHFISQRLFSFIAWCLVSLKVLLLHHKDHKCPHI